MENSPIVHIISGPTNAGKTTICNAILGIYGDKLESIITSTTRTPRPGEIHGTHYYFYTQEEFEEKIEKNEFIEYSTVHTNLYGSTYEELERIIESGKSPIYNVNPQGMVHLRHELGSRGYRVMSYFIDAPMEVLEQRLLTRGSEDENARNIRLANAIIEKEHAILYDYVIENLEIEDTLKELATAMGLNS